MPASIASSHAPSSVRGGRLRRAAERGVWLRRIGLIIGCTLLAGSIHLLVLGGIAGNHLKLSLRLVQAAACCVPAFAYLVLTCLAWCAYILPPVRRRVDQSLPCGNTLRLPVVRWICRNGAPDVENYVIGVCVFLWHLTLAGAITTAWHGVHPRDTSKVAFAALTLGLGLALIVVDVSVVRGAVRGLEDGDKTEVPSRPGVRWTATELATILCASHFIAAAAVLVMYWAYDGYVEEFYAVVIGLATGAIKYVG